MLNKVTRDDVLKYCGEDSVFVTWWDVMKLLEEITAANTSTFSKYDINQILQREGVRLPTRTSW